MKPLNTLIKYENQQTKGNFYSYTKKNKNYNTQNNNIAFKGRVLDSIGQLGAKPEVSNLVSTAGFIGIRPPITMADKKTPKKERVYSAFWQTGMAIGGLAVQLLYNRRYEQFANFLSQKILGLNGKDKLTDSEKRLANNRSAIVEAIHRNPDETKEILHRMTPEQAAARMKQYDEELVKRSKPTLKTIMAAANPLNIFKNQTHGENPYRDNPGLIRQIRAEYGKQTAGYEIKQTAKKAGKQAEIIGKSMIDSLLNNKNRTKQILEVSGASKMIHFVVLLSSLNLATLLVTRYMDPLMKFVGNTFDIKALQKKEKSENDATVQANKSDNKKSDKKKFNWLDKTIFSALGGLAALEAVNIAGWLINGKKVGNQFVGKVAKGISKNLNIDKGFDRLMNSSFNKIKNNPKKREGLASQANLNDKWVERNVIANLLMRLGITAPTIFVFGKAAGTDKNSDKSGPNEAGKAKKEKKGSNIRINNTALYNTTRIVVDEAMNLTLLNAADKAAIVPASIAIAKALGKSPSNQGIKVITDQGIKNILLVCTIMGFLNNAISRPVVKSFKKLTKKLGLKEDSAKKMEKGYREYRRRFLATQHLMGYNSDPLSFSENSIKLKQTSMV